MSKRCYKSQLKHKEQVPVTIMALYYLLFILTLAYIEKWSMNFTIVCIVVMVIIIHIIGLFHANRLKEWDMGGYQELIIDSTKRCLVFDKTLEVDFNMIQSIETVVHSYHPPKPIGKSYWYIPNAEILFNLRYGTQINFHVHNYNHLFSMVKHFKNLGLPVKSTTLNALKRLKLKQLLIQQLPIYISTLIIVGYLCTLLFLELSHSSSSNLLETACLLI